ncbi:MAG: DUF3892 domain-containing protein [Erysipelotrichaceae bacterium]
MKKTKKVETNKQERFIAARRNKDGSLKEFKSASGKVYDYEQALEAVEQGLIENALPFTGRDGSRHIRGLNDGKDKSNLKNLKKF